MNTGIQRSSATPFGASTTTAPAGKVHKGKDTEAKNMPMIMSMHNIAYTATATLSHLEDYAKKLKRLKKKPRRVSYICMCSVHVW